MGERQIEDKGQLNLIDLLDDLMLSDDKSQNEDLNHEKQISLMTVHASKGLEFPAVFVCGLEEELFPHKNSLTTPLGLDEERRLFYVAITRAKKCLNLSYARERYSNFQKQSKKPSRFLDELPQEGVVVDRDVKNHLRAHQSVEEKRGRNLARLSQLKNRLKSGF
jgi:superfamily I DNA/RNA helicase